MVQSTFLCVSIFLVTLSTTVSAQGISWISPKTARRSVTEFLFRGDLIPAGMEEGGGKVTYPCRARHNGRLIPGKLIVHMGEKVECAVVEYHAEVTYPEFEILFTPPGWTSWIVPNDRHIRPENAILGGSHPSRETAEVCRVKYGENDVIPGKYSARDGACWFGKDGNEHKALENFEILVSNMYGLAKQGQRG